MRQKTATVRLQQTGITIAGPMTTYLRTIGQW